MAESKRDAPHFYMTIEFDMTECVRLKEGVAAARPDAPVSYTHLLLRGVALSLLQHPRINARYAPEDAIEFPDGVHLGLAVAAEQGLIVPVLHHCESKDVFEIALEARALVERVRAGKAQGEDLTGGTFTVSNLGMHPIEEFAAVINPPQAAVLAVGALKDRPVVRNGQIVVAPTMRATLSSDHRVIDGVEAARFLETLKSVLENPVQLFL
jgi:pyruvate dehydrogenase E2 component (dihydrolipoamide acetyltransferase)